MMQNMKEQFTIVDIMMSGDTKKYITLTLQHTNVIPILLCPYNPSMTYEDFRKANINIGDIVTLSLNP